MTLQQYSQLDLSHDSPTAKALLSRLDQESSSNSLSLTAVHSNDGTPPYLTHAMNAWFNQYIQPLRHGAIHEIVDTFHSMVVPRSGIRGRLIEHEHDGIESEAFRQIARERALFASNTNIMDVHRELSQERERYELLMQQHGEPVKWQPFLYYAILFVMIFVLEGLINFESFLKISGFTPALSTGSFLVVSAAFAVSAHLVGMTIKQWKERVGGGVSRTEKRKNATLFIGAILLFFLAFSFVVYARWALLGDVILRKSQTTGEAIGTEEIVRFAGTLIGNVIVYLMGVVWSYIRHDAIPGFSELRRRVEKLERRESALIEKQLASRMRRHLGKAQSAAENLQRVEQAQSVQFPDYHSGRALFNKLREQDARVIAILQEYRSGLFERVKRNRGITLTYEDISKLGIDNIMTITADEWAARPIKLPYA